MLEGTLEGWHGNREASPGLNQHPSREKETHFLIKVGESTLILARLLAAWGALKGEESFDSLHTDLVSPHLSLCLLSFTVKLQPRGHRGGHPAWSSDSSELPGPTGPTPPHCAPGQSHTPSGPRPRERAGRCGEGGWCPAYCGERCPEASPPRAHHAAERERRPGRGGRGTLSSRLPGLQSSADKQSKLGIKTSLAPTSRQVVFQTGRKHPSHHHRQPQTFRRDSAGDSTESGHAEGRGRDGAQPAQPGPGAGPGRWTEGGLPEWRAQGWAPPAAPRGRLRGARQQGGEPRGHRGGVRHRDWLMPSRWPCPPHPREASVVTGQGRPPCMGVRGGRSRRAPLPRASGLPPDFLPNHSPWDLQGPWLGRGTTPGRGSSVWNCRHETVDITQELAPEVLMPSPGLGAAHSTRWVSLWARRQGKERRGWSGEHHLHGGPGRELGTKAQVGEGPLAPGGGSLHWKEGPESPLPCVVPQHAHHLGLAQAGEEKALPGASVATGDPALIPLLTPPHGARVWTVTFPLWPAQWKPLAGWEGTWGRPSWAVTLTMYSHKPQPTASHNAPADTSSATPQATRAGHSSCERNREGWRDRPTEPGWPEWTLGTRPRPPPSLPQPCPASAWQGPRSPLETAPSHGH